jgi:hypothetical protein
MVVYRFAIIPTFKLYSLILQLNNFIYLIVTVYYLCSILILSDSDDEKDDISNTKNKNEIKIIKII